MPWMKVQCQDCGSYRSDDVVEALDWMLPNATKSSESVVVLLDWFAGHLTDAVAEKIRSKGHVLLLHGGGTTPFTQINDTHLHAQLAAHLVRLEVRWNADERQRLMALKELFPKRSSTPSQNRYNILSLVQTAWLLLDHGRIAEKGYRQTGPTMPLEGLFSTRTSIATSSMFSAESMETSREWR